MKCSGDTVDENEWKSQQVAICNAGCSSVSWCPYRPTGGDGVNVMHLAIGAGDKCVYVLKCVHSYRVKRRCTNSPSNAWEIESKLRGHGDRVRDVSWCPFIGFPVNMIASCSRVGESGGSNEVELRIARLEPKERRRVGRVPPPRLFGTRVARELEHHRKPSCCEPRSGPGGPLEGDDRWELENRQQGRKELVCCSFSFCVIVGICPMTGEEKEKEGKKEKDLQWLQQMKARHNQNVKAMSGKRINKLKRAIEKKVQQAIEEPRSFLFCY